MFEKYKTRDCKNCGQKIDIPRNNQGKISVGAGASAYYCNTKCKKEFYKKIVEHAYKQTEISHPILMTKTVTPSRTFTVTISPDMEKSLKLDIGDKINIYITKCTETQ